mmetsp:Transcript_7681/g.28173  ORF Transcript_7681/g.28173 Transcript_7681/m.28173 type:complete len:208 (-) Transcript_7681:69-692(-)
MCRLVHSRPRRENSASARNAAPTAPGVEPKKKNVQFTRLGRLRRDKLWQKVAPCHQDLEVRRPWRCRPRQRRLRSRTVPSRNRLWRIHRPRLLLLLLLLFVFVRSIVVVFVFFVFVRFVVVFVLAQPSSARRPFTRTRSSRARSRSRAIKSKHTTRAVVNPSVRACAGVGDVVVNRSRTRFPSILSAHTTRAPTAAAAAGFIARVRV